MDLAESIEILGPDMRRASAAELPRYQPLLAHLAERFGWAPERYRGYRLRMQYPVYGWQVSLSFDPPRER